MNDQFLSQTEHGTLFGVSSHKIGKWLIGSGLRTVTKKPSPKAFKGGYVDQRGSTQPGTYIWIWHREKTTAAFKEAGFTPVVNIDSGVG